MLLIHSFKYTIIWGLIILFFCLVNFNSGNSESIFADLLFFDKIIHLFIFFVFSILLLIDLKNLYQKLSRKHYLITFFLSFFYALLTELMQKNFTSYRSFEWYDILADVLGIILALILFKLNRAFFLEKLINNK
ncbi:MAG: VanZ family protein [bacterium]